MDENKQGDKSGRKRTILSIDIVNRIGVLGGVAGSGVSGRLTQQYSFVNMYKRRVRTHAQRYNYATLI